MSLLLSTGIWGFITSAAKKSGGYVSTFVSGLSGWIIKHNGDAEFKSIYARDKIVTNEYVYNRIRVTEDEEVVTSNGKILSATDNEDGTYTVYLDLREGDSNPFVEGDLLQGYYHSTENSGVIYAVQKLTVIEDPNMDDQSMLVTCENGSLPYKYMIIVRIGNTINSDRQSFIKISSRTNCQYFHDGINSFAALDNPDNVKCVLGKADMGLVPSWAQAAINGVRKWFGLIADGVILRGTFILKSSGTTVEEELDGMANQVRSEYTTDFSILSGKVESKVSQTDFDALGNRVSSAESSITQLPNQITLSVTESKQYTDGKVDAVQVGGRNLLTVSDFNTLNTSYYYSNNATYKLSLDNGMLKVVGQDIGNADLYFLIKHLSYNESEDYVFSFDAYAQAETTIGARLGYSDVQSGGTALIGITKKRYYLKLKGVYRSDTYKSLFVWFDKATTVWFDNMKLEKGNKATDWTPAPEDVDSVRVGGRNYFSLNEFQSLSPESWDLNAYVYRFNLEPNTEYTVSSNVPEQPGLENTSIYFNGSGTSNDGVWKGRPVTKNSGETGELYIAIPTKRWQTDNLRNGVYWVQLEKGNKANDWAPAPEDVDAEINKRPTTDQIKAEFTIDPTGISMLGKKIALTGMVTFTALDASAQATINSKVTGNDIATKLGYSNYTDMINKAAAGQTIINGGYIRTSLIDVDSLITNTLLTKNLMIPIHVLPYEDPCTLDFNSSFSFDAKLYGFKPGGDYITLPSAEEYEGIECTIFNGLFASTKSYYGVAVQVQSGRLLNLPYSNNNLPIGFVLPLGKIIRLKAVSAGFLDEDVIYWYVLNPEDLTERLIYP